MRLGSVPTAQVERPDGAVLDKRAARKVVEILERNGKLELPALGLTRAAVERAVQMRGDFYALKVEVFQQHVRENVDEIAERALGVHLQTNIDVQGGPRVDEDLDRIVFVSRLIAVFVVGGDVRVFAVEANIEIVVVPKETHCGLLFGSGLCVPWKLQRQRSCVLPRGLVDSAVDGDVTRRAPNLVGGNRSADSTLVRSGPEPRGRQQQAENGSAQARGCWQRVENTPAIAADTANDKPTELCRVPIQCSERIVFLEMQQGRINDTTISRS